MKSNTIKVCPDPHCDSVYHNCNPEPRKDTRCHFCGCGIIKVNEKTALKIMRKTWTYECYQYDYQTGEIDRRLSTYDPIKGKQLELFDN